MLPVIALVGRPNVGKSTLFNQLTRSRDALVADFAGLTRDRKYGEARVGSRPFIVIDTGGISGDEAGIDQAMAGQSMTAIEEADALLVAGSSLMVYSGFRFCRLAYELGKPVLIVNRGRTRADDLATLKLADDCHKVLTLLANQLDPGGQTLVRTGQVY